ncbi:hypothetical protein VTI74DRAFT_8237 [Chaetomium olivicolor]
MRRPDAMPLVDYSSDSNDTGSGPELSESPPKKKPKTASLPPNSGSGSGSGSSSDLPPLPASFHDLYASSVRTTTRDDPTLHQGRTRQIPHVAGNWPSHIYVEWHPASQVHALLTELVTSLQAQAKTSSGVEVASFLLSDLGAPQPLHISLSRPIVLSTEQKDNFLADVVGTIRSSGITAFSLDCSRVEWHRTSESGRSFLVLRVHTGQLSGDEKRDHNPNPELTELLRRCNKAVARYGQPGLYQWAEEEGSRRVGEAFHVSIAWSFAQPTEELNRLTEKVFVEGKAEKTIAQLQVPVEGVKVKIGNVVTHVPLPQPGSRPSGRLAKNLLGL